MLAANAALSVHDGRLAHNRSMSVSISYKGRDIGSWSLALLAGAAAELDPRSNGGAA